MSNTNELTTGAGRPAITDDPALDKIVATGRQTVARLTATLPRTTDTQRMELATWCSRLEQAFMAGVQVGLAGAQSDAEQQPLWDQLAARQAFEVAAWAL